MGKHCLLFEIDRIEGYSIVFIFVKTSAALLSAGEDTGSGCAREMQHCYGYIAHTVHIATWGRAHAYARSTHTAHHTHSTGNDSDTTRTERHGGTLPSLQHTHSNHALHMHECVRGGCATTLAQVQCAEGHAGLSGAHGACRDDEGREQCVLRASTPPTLHARAPSLCHDVH